MNQQRKKAANQLTQEGYRHVSGQFSATRNAPWGDFDWLRPYIKEGFSILDLGCGNGRLWATLRSYQDLRYTGIDANTFFIQEAKRMYSQDGSVAQFLEGDMTDLTSVIGEKQYDIVTMIASFHHLCSLEDRMALLNWINIHLKSNGIIFMINWNLLRPTFRKKSVLRYLLFRFFNNEYRKILKDNSVLTIKKNAFRDVWTLWQGRGKKALLYYRAFTVNELNSMLSDADFSDIESFYSKRGEIKHWWSGENIITVAKIK